ncbi:PAS sensor protein [Mesorhizobium sp. ORS 3324]|nr:PAS sensor protein [Mesorhizobium sp. ORS 3324]
MDLTSYAGSQIDLMQGLPVAVYTTDKDGYITFFNEAAAELWGRRPIIGKARWCGSWRLRHLDGSSMAHEECSLAIALMQSRDVYGGKAVAERPDGQLIPLVAHPVLLRDRAGNVVGAMNTLLDLRTQTRADESDMRLAAIVESSMDAIVSKDMNGTITSWNDAAVNLFGYTAAEAIGRPVTMLIPHDRLDEETTIMNCIRAGQRMPTFETVRLRKNGIPVPVSLTVSPIRDGDGSIIGASKIVRDISSHKESEQRIKLLMREVNHRVKNQYAVILSMIRQIGKLTSTPDRFLDHVRDRITALSDSHDLLVEGGWRGAAVRELVEAQLKPFVASPRLSMTGPAILLGANAVQYLGIAFHELATNSAKYGALSRREGHIEVRWEVEGANTFRLVWRETGGPAMKHCDRQGFGMLVLKHVAPQAMGGSSQLEFSKSGLAWTLTTPLRSVQSAAEENSIGFAAAASH